LKELERNLQRLPEKIRKKHVKAILSEAAELVRAEAARRVPTRKRTTGWLKSLEDDPRWPDNHRLKNNITKKVSVTSRRARAWVGIDYTKVGHGHLVEFGHKLIIRGQSRGRVKPHPFMRPAIDAKSAEVLSIITDGLRRAVEREANG
jgi:HK97 gp10 family phage protein